MIDLLILVAFLAACAYAALRDADASEHCQRPEDVLERIDPVIMG